jgi:hypothetical protein
MRRELQSKKPLGALQHNPVNCSDVRSVLRRFRTRRIPRPHERASQRCVKTPKKLKKIEAGVNFTEAKVEIGRVSSATLPHSGFSERISGLRASQNQ